MAIVPNTTVQYKGDGKEVKSANPTSTSGTGSGIRFSVDGGGPFDTLVRLYADGGTPTDTTYYFYEHLDGGTI